MQWLGDLLGFGITGFGLALAILTYKLLAAEQAIQKPRARMITAIYVFMVFSLVLSGGGLFYEIEKLPGASIAGEHPAQSSHGESWLSRLWGHIRRSP